MGNFEIPTELPLNAFVSFVEDTPLGQEVERTLNLLETIQQTLIGLAEQQDQQQLLNIKIGTVLTLALLKKLQDGKPITSFSGNDWQEVAEAVSEYAVRMDEERYSEFVFTLYAEYIEASTSVLGGRASEFSIDAILALSNELATKAQELEKGDLTEPDYVESCLWISLEAMVKLLSAYAGSIGGPEAEKITTSIAQLAFEFGRYQLYAKEQQLVTQYLEHQQKINAELEEQYRSYLSELENRSSQFMELIENAFSPNIKEQLQGSIALARAVGVPVADILDSPQKIDEFFLS